MSRPGLASCWSLAPDGIGAAAVAVEAHVGRGLPSLGVIGLLVKLHPHEFGIQGFRGGTGGQSEHTFLTFLLLLPDQRSNLLRHKKGPVL